MSTYYYFRCDGCREIGGLFTRQAWGWGNFDIIASFKFLAWHSENCGPGNIISVVDEHYDRRGDRHPALDPTLTSEFIEKTRGIFPRSRDWNLSACNDVVQMESQWERGEQP